MADEKGEVAARVAETTAVVETPTLQEPAFLTGDTVGHYTIEGELGAGGCARVFLATSKEGRRVALKVLDLELAGNANMVKRFLREAEVVNKIRHPNVAEIYELGMFSNGRPFFFMELIEGKSLSNHIRDSGRLSVTETWELLNPLCSALQAAHDIGVVHRDVKGSNVMLRSSGGEGRLKLLDFGIAKLLHPDESQPALTAEAQVLGSPGFMSPEQILGQPVDQRTDVYATGVMLFSMLTGSLPFASTNSRAIFRMHLVDERPKPSSLSPVSGLIDAVVTKAMAKQAEARFGSMRELAAAFKAALDASTFDGPAHRTTTPATTAHACAIHVRASVRPDLGDDALEELGLAFLDLEDRLSAEGYSVISRNSTSMTAVRVLPAVASQRRDPLAAGVALAERLFDESQAAFSQVEATLCIAVHEGAVDVRSREAGPTVIGGELTQVENWPVTFSAGWHVTPQLREALQGR